MLWGMTLNHSAILTPFSVFLCAICAFFVNFAVKKNFNNSIILINGSDSCGKRYEVCVLRYGDCYSIILQPLEVILYFFTLFAPSL